MASKIIDTSYIKRRWTDIRYSEQSESQKLDIYLPDEGEDKFPIILSIHGGAFMKGDKVDHQLKPMLEGLSKGYAVVSINYRLSGEEIFPAQIYDVKAAVRFIKANADKYMLDKDRIVAWGGSAGGHLSALLGTSIGVTELEDLSMGNEDESSSVSAVVDWFGPMLFSKMDEQLKEFDLHPQDHNEENSPESRLLGAQITKIPEMVKLACPFTYITKDIPPFFIQHGNKDNLVPHQQSILLKNKILDIKGNKDIYFEVLDGATHGSSEFTTKENIEKVFEFIDKYLKK